MVNIKLKYVTLNTTCIQQIGDFFCQVASLFLLMVTVFLFELLYACTPHRPPQAASVRHWKRSRSVLFGHLIHDSHSWFWAGSISRERA